MNRLRAVTLTWVAAIAAVPAFIAGELIGEHLHMHDEPVALHCVIESGSNELMCALDCETPKLCNDDSMLVRIYEKGPASRQEHQVESGHITAAHVSAP